ENQSQTYYKEHEAFTRQQAAYEEERSRIPQDLQNKKELEQTIHQMKKADAEQEKAWQLAEQNLKEYEAAYTKAKTTLSHIKEQKHTKKETREQEKQKNKKHIIRKKKQRTATSKNNNTP